MGDTDGAQGKLESYVELDEPGKDPVAGSGYDASSEPTAAVDLDELEPVDEPSWQESEEKTQHVYLDELEDAEGEEAAAARSWNDEPMKTEAVDLDDLEVLEKLDPKEANQPPALPEVGERRHAPHAPLPTRRGAAKAKAKAKPEKKPAPRPRSAPPPPPRPPTRQESLKEAPKPMIGGEGWVPEGRVSVVDFSAVLSQPPPPRKDEPTEKVAVGSPISAPVAAPPEEESGSGFGKLLLVLLLVGAVGAGAYFLGQQGSAGESVTESESSGSPTREDFESAWGDDESESESEAESEAESESESEAESEAEAEAESEPATTMRQPMLAEPRETSTTSAMRATMAAATTESTTSAMEAAPAETMEAEPAETMEAEPTETAMEAAPSELPAHPSREQVQAALNGVKPAVAACMEGEHATVRVRVTVRGSGRVTTAVVQDSLYARPPIGSCIARAVRNASFPQFSEPSFVVLYPFQI